MEFRANDYLHSQGEIVVITSDVVVVEFINTSGEGEEVITPKTINLEEITTEIVIAGIHRYYPVETGRIIFWRRIVTEVDDEELTAEDHFFTTPLKK